MQLEKKEYKFKCGVEASQSEATYKSDKKLTQIILKKLDIKSLTELKDKMKVTDLIEKLVNEDILLSALDVILKVSTVPEEMKSTDFQAQWDNLTREEIIEIVNDFFTLSPSLSKLLGIGKSGQASQSE